MNWLRTALAGLIIGTGAAAPGISGGSIAVATGIYEQFFGYRYNVSARRKALDNCTKGREFNEKRN